MDLFAQGVAEIHVRPNRELQTLASLDVTRARAELGEDVGRFTGASMISEIVLRFPYEEEAAGIFGTVEDCFDRIAAAPSTRTLDSALGGAWRIIAELGFTPALDMCANCHSPLDPAASVAFSHSAGGALCARCGGLAAGSRVIPPAARDAIRTWVSGGDTPDLANADARAHQRLLREFFQEHMGSDRELRAFRVWELGAWGGSAA
jgi:DNA repair protein RecO (recombination protein O)